MCVSLALTFLDKQSMQVTGKTGQRMSFSSCTYMQPGIGLTIRVRGKIQT